MPARRGAHLRVHTHLYDPNGIRAEDGTKDCLTAGAFNLVAEACNRCNFADWLTNLRSGSRRRLSAIAACENSAATADLPVSESYGWQAKLTHPSSCGDYFTGYRRICPTSLVRSTPATGVNFCTRPAMQSARKRFPSWSVEIPCEQFNRPASPPGAPQL